MGYYQSMHWQGLRKQALQRDGYRCTVPGCGDTHRLHVDHIKTRPRVDHPTPLDTLSNLRTLCDYHDRQIKERPSGRRANDGKLTVKGCKADGTPADPNHAWGK